MILIAGPCVIESKEILEQTVESILETISEYDIDFYFKSSWKKDNRTYSNLYSGLYPDDAISLLVDIKSKYKVKICTDIHLPSDLHHYHLDSVDMIQIPAFLAKQQSLLKISSEYCNKNNKTLHIKKPQFVGPEEINNIVGNAQIYGAKNIITTDRGTMLGYDKVFMDPRHVSIMKKSGSKVLCDVTHPNKNFPGDLIENIKALGCSYMAAGADGIFLETHPNCESALCDAKTMLPCSELSDVMKEIYKHVK